MTHWSNCVPGFVIDWWLRRVCRVCGETRYNHPFGQLHPCGNAYRPETRHRRDRKPT